MDPPFDPLPPLAPPPPADRGVRCTICWWSGEAFDGVEHSESATCPACGAIARDRWLFHCLFARVKLTARTRMLETSPRLDERYREAMGRRLRYRSSDHDQRAHRAELTLDVQSLDLPDGGLDVVLTAHVLEHVPDTDAALRELFRVLRPGGSAIILVPVVQGVTAPPREPEYHEDNTLVHWRFGPDLTARLRGHGFETALLCTRDFERHARARDGSWPGREAPEWDARELVEAVDPDDLTVIVEDDQARTAWLNPGYMYLGWHARRPARRWLPWRGRAG